MGVLQQDVDLRIASEFKSSQESGRILRDFFTRKMEGHEGLDRGSLKELGRLTLNSTSAN